MIRSSAKDYRST